MITSPAFAGKRYAVLGLARSGLTAAEALLASGAEVMAWDNREEARDALAGKAEIADPLTTPIEGFDGVVVSPGVPINRHPIADRAREAGVPLIGDIELFAQARPTLPPHKVVGITGTNGKSTTTALVHHILKTAGVPTTMAGNIGFPILGQDPLPGGGVYVLELSSYQLDLTHSLDCDVAVLTNITPDHLDRYDGFEAYKLSKARLFEMQSPGHIAVFGVDDREARLMALAHGLQLHVDELSLEREGSGAPRWGLRTAEIANIADQSRWPALQGPHNAQNAACAIEICRELGLSDELIEMGLSSYPALPHRMQPVATKHGVLFVNDSKATNPDSTAPALAAFPAIHWIVGGLAKTHELGPMEAQLGHVRAAYTIGESAAMFAELLDGKVPVENCELLVEAVRHAAAAAKPGEVVLLSPACASFDQFRDFEARGDVFRAAVEALT